MLTQWRTVEMGTKTGMDYNVLFVFMGRLRLSDDEFDNLLSDIRVMEAEALAIWRENG